MILEIVLDLIYDAFHTWDTTDYRRCKRAYHSAWRDCGQRPGGPLEALREAFKEEHVPGAYVDPDGPRVAPWLSAWRDGLDPRSAAHRVRASRKRDSHGP